MLRNRECLRCCWTFEWKVMSKELKVMRVSLFTFYSLLFGSWVKRVKGNQLSNESGRDTFDIASEFTQGNVASQVLLMNPFERTNEVAHIGPQPFGGVAVDFTEAVPIVIARPFMLTMTDAVALTSDAVVALVFIGVDNRLAQGKAVRMGTQSGTLGVCHHPPPHLSGFASYHAQHRRTIISVGTTTPLLVSPAARRVGRIKMFLPFFPPRSETSHRFRSRYRVVGYRVASGWRWLAVHGGCPARSGSSRPTQRPAWSSLHLLAPRAAARPPAVGSDAAAGTRSRYTGCKSAGNAYSDRPSVGFSWSDGGRRHRPPMPGSGDTSVRRGGSSPESIVRFVLD